MQKDCFAFRWGSLRASATWGTSPHVERYGFLTVVGRVLTEPTKKPIHKDGGRGEGDAPSWSPEGVGATLKVKSSATQSRPDPPSYATSIGRRLQAACSLQNGGRSAKHYNLHLREQSPEWCRCSFLVVLGQLPKQPACDIAGPSLFLTGGIRKSIRALNALLPTGHHHRSNSVIDA
mmetsp:Transcript_26729/g.86552  ORF Transcript_26729/g.86552 Transcript_26729/m.86552 type:complete len:177 (+) Transcript_26729:488-1018(+)